MDLAWPLPAAHVLEDPVVGVQLQPAGQVADRCTAASSQVISHRSLRSISASMAMSPSGRPAIGTRETAAWALTVPLGLNWSTTFRTSGLSALSSVSSIGTDSAVMSSLTTASGPGFVDGPLHAAAGGRRR